MTTKVTVQATEHARLIITHEIKTETGEWRVQTVEPVAVGASADFWVWDTKRLIVEEECK